MRTTAMWILLGVLVGLGGQPSEAGTGDHAQARQQHRHHHHGAAALEALAVDRYVAIGDSYTAGSGIPPDDGSGCLRSKRDYPKRLADRLGARLSDMSCAGARVGHVEQPQSMPSVVNPPQGNPLGRATDLVTFSLGINDAGFSTILQRCLDIAAMDPAGAPCRDSFRTLSGDSLLAGIPAVEAELEKEVRYLQRTAPNARIVLVGYPQPVPSSGTCVALPFAAGDYAYVAEFFAAVNRAVRTAAAHTGSAFADVLTASAGHDACAGDDAWVLGGIPRPHAMVWHPLAQEHRAVASLVVDALRKTTNDTG